MGLPRSTSCSRGRRSRATSATWSNGSLRRGVSWVQTRNGDGAPQDGDWRGSRWGTASVVWVTVRPGCQLTSDMTGDCGTWDVGGGQAPSRCREANVVQLFSFDHHLPRLDPPVPSYSSILSYHTPAERRCRTLPAPSSNASISPPFVTPPQLPHPAPFASSLNAPDRIRELGHRVSLRSSR